MTIQKHNVNLNLIYGQYKIKYFEVYVLSTYMEVISIYYPTEMLENVC